MGEICSLPVSQCKKEKFDLSEPESHTSRNYVVSTDHWHVYQISKNSNNKSLRNLNVLSAWSPESYPLRSSI